MIKKILIFLISGFIIFVGNNTVFAQSYTVLQGIVYCETGQNPIGFANISVKNTPTGTATDALGKFKIEIAREKQTVIIVSHINYHKKEIVINDSLLSQNLKIYLEPKSIQLSDVVISAGLYINTPHPQTTD